MSDNSKIEWTEATWNPVRGCTRVSPGCGGPGKQGGCYAEGIAARFSGPGQPYEGFAEMRNGEPHWTGKLALIESALTVPLRWKKPRRVFVNSMSDLFHERLKDEDIDRVFAVMALCPQHTFQVLTKRAERMQDYCSTLSSRSVAVAQAAVWLGIWHDPDSIAIEVNDLIDRPLLNVWLGVSAERQEEADERIPLLLQTPAAVRFVSLEPLLGPINVSRYCWPVCWAWDAKYRSPEEAKAAGAYAEQKRQSLVHADARFLDWAIVGGESGPKARPMHPQWARDLRDQCTTAGVSFFFKQWGEWREPIGDEDYDTSKGRGGNPPAFIISMDGTVHCFTHLGDDHRPVVIRVGKKAAGRLLDGRTWDEMPGRAA